MLIDDFKAHLPNLDIVLLKLHRKDFSPLMRGKRMKRIMSIARANQKKNLKTKLMSAIEIIILGVMAIPFKFSKIK